MTLNAEDLRREVSGEVIHPESLAYDEARAVWNGMIDRRPLAIVRAASTADIPPVVRFAHENDLLLAVRGGGHNVAGNGTVEGGIVLDLGGLKDVAVDSDEATVTASPDVTLGDLDRATEREGVIVPVGVVSGTGLFGLTLGGGINIYGYWGDAAQDIERIAWTRLFHGALQPSARAGEYVNFLGTEGTHADARQLALTSYGQQKFDRLVALKRQYDPDQPVPSEPQHPARLTAANRHG